MAGVGILSPQYISSPAVSNGKFRIRCPRSELAKWLPRTCFTRTIMPKMRQSMKPLDHILVLSNTSVVMSPRILCSRPSAMGPPLLSDRPLTLAVEIGQGLAHLQVRDVLG
jgi:hypothetical protein